MRRYISIILLSLAGCNSESSFSSGVKPTTVTNSTVVFPNLPDIDKPLPPVLKPVVFDYPRDISKPKQSKNTPECQGVQPIPSECLEYPILKNINIFVGMDQQSFKNYVSNQEQTGSFSRILNTRIDEINAERAKWRESSQPKEVK